MKNNKGFTLVELLAVIVVIALITTIAVPSAMGISNKIKVKMYCAKIDEIEVQAKAYGEDRRDSLTTTGINVTVKDLVNSGYLKQDQDKSPYVVDPRDSQTTELYNMSFKIYLKYNRVYVDFNSTVNTTCDK